MMSVHKSIYICSTFLFLIISCNTNNVVEELADTFCSCGEPLAKWKKELEFHYEKLSEGTVIKKQVEDCLAPEKIKYIEKKSDMKFQENVAKKLNETCPELQQSLPALFSILFAED